MNFYKALLLFSIVISMYCASCDYGPCYRHFDNWTDRIMKVDSFFLSADTINSTENLRVSFWAKIGNRIYCDSFGYYQMTRYQFAVNFTLYEKYFDVCPDTCKQTPVYMSGNNYFLNAPFASGDYTVTVHQPDGSILRKYFHVR